MKAILCIVAMFTTTTLLAQLNGFDYIEYKRKVKDATGTFKEVGSVRMWYNEKSSYQQSLPMVPTVNLSPVASKATQEDSVVIKNYIAESLKHFYAHKWFAQRVDSDTNRKVLSFNYDLNPPKLIAYWSNRKIKDSVVFVSGKIMNILGVPCNLAIAYMLNVNNFRDTAQIWYAPNLPFAYGPRSYIDLVPGLILRVDGSREIYEAQNLEIPATTVGNFDLDARADQIYSHEEVSKMAKEYAERVNKTTSGAKSM